MMDEQLQQLAERVEQLVTRLDEYRNENQRLQGENGELRQALEAAETQGADAEQLRGKISELEGQLQTKSEKETEMRDRLQGILSRITEIETQTQPVGESQGG